MQESRLRNSPVQCGFSGSNRNAIFEGHDDKSFPNIKVFRPFLPCEKARQVRFIAKIGERNRKLPKVDGENISI